MSAVYANRRRVQGSYGKSLLRRRGEFVERSFAHCYDTGSMRRTHLRRHENILKRQLVHVGAFNLSLIFRKRLGAGTPREWKSRGGALVLSIFALLIRRQDRHRRSKRPNVRCLEVRPTKTLLRVRPASCRKIATYTTGC